jgi:hypothetical protein
MLSQKCKLYLVGGGGGVPGGGTDDLQQGWSGRCRWLGMLSAPQQVRTRLYQGRSLAFTGRHSLAGPE